MTFKPDNSIAPFVATSVYLPDDLVQMRDRLTVILQDMAYKINQREISAYEQSELLTGESWFSTQVFNKRQTFREVVVFPNVAGTATTSVPHNLTITSSFTFTHIYGTLNLPNTPLFLGIPSGLPDDVSITVDAVNVNIITATGTYNGSNGIVVLEYLKN